MTNEPRMLTQEEVTEIASLLMHKPDIEIEFTQIPLAVVWQQFRETQRLAGEYMTAVKALQADDASTGKVMGLWKKQEKAEKALRAVLPKAKP